MLISWFGLFVLFWIACVSVCLRNFWGFICLRYRITKRLMVNSYVNVVFLKLTTNFMVIGLKIIEPNIDNKIFPYWPVLCSLFQGTHERRQEGYTGRFGNITESPIGFPQTHISSPHTYW